MVNIPRQCMKQYIISTAVYHKNYKEHLNGLEEISNIIPASICRRMDSFSKMAFYTSMLSIQKAGYKKNIEDAENFGTAFSTYWGPFKATEVFFKELIDIGAELVSPSLFPQLVTNASMGIIAKYYKLKGPSVFNPGVCPVSYAQMMMSTGKCRRMLVTSCDELFENNYNACVEAGLIDSNGMITNTSEPPMCSSMSLVLENKENSDGVCLYSTNTIYVSFEKDSDEEIIESTANLIIKTLGNIKKNEIKRVVSFGRMSLKMRKMQSKVLKRVFDSLLDEITVSEPKYGGSFGTETVASIIDATEYLREEKSNSKVLCLSAIYKGGLTATILGGIYE